jgi:hypothetical protein
MWNTVGGWIKCWRVELVIDDLSARLKLYADY